MISDMNKSLEKLVNLPFDLFTRNYIASSTIEKFEQIYGKLKILDVGGRNGYLQKFLPQDDVFVLDLREPEDDFDKDLFRQGKYTVGDILEIDIQNKTFDFVVAMDLLEHIASPDRLKVVGKMLAMSRLGIIIGGPFDQPLTEPAEQILNEYFKILKGEAHPWLMEHIAKRPLPSEKMLDDYLRERKYSFFKIPTNNIYLWTWMQHLIFIAYRFGVDIHDLYMTYNLAFLARKINDGELPVYRYIYLICAEEKFLNFVDKSFFADSLEKQIEKFRLINNIFKKISDYLREKEDYINYLREKEDYIKIIESGQGWRLLTKYFKIRDKLLPTGTRKREIVRLVFQAILNIISGNLRESIYKETRLLFRNIKEIAARRYPSFQNLENVYKLWIEKEEPKEEDLINQRLSRFFIEPKISIIVPTFNPAEHFLRDMIESVLNQTYSNWELCIAEGGNKEGHVRKVLKEYSEKDSRVKIRVLDENKSIAGNSNEALSIASGEYIAFLDHEDRLPRFALFEVVKAINQNPHTDFLYSDEDKIDERGKRRDPFFKPDWSPNMFLSFNYLGHLCVIRKKLLDKVEGFREGYDGSYDYDLFLRVIEFTAEKRITHIPRILYHCRITYGSAAGSNLGKAYDYASAKKALRDAMERRAVEIEDVTDGICAGSYRIKYKIIGNPKVSILIPTKDHVKILETCIASILSKTDYDNYEIVIIDNESREEKTFKYYDEMKKNSKIKIIEYNKPFNFSAINNFAASMVNSKYILFLNNDTEVISREWVGAMLEHAQRDEVGAVGAKLLYPNNKIQHVGVILGLGPHEVAGHPYYKYPNQNGYFGRINIIGNYSALTAACLMVRKEVFEEVGGFEESFSHAYNDVDLCMKIRQKGYLIVWTLYAELYHHESKSRGYEDTPEKQERFRKEIVLFQQRWGDVLQKGDPYYNPNLSLRREDFSIKL